MYIPSLAVRLSVFTAIRPLKQTARHRPVLHPLGQTV